MVRALPGALRIQTRLREQALVVGGGVRLEDLVYRVSVRVGARVSGRHLGELVVEPLAQVRCMEI